MIAVITPYDTADAILVEYATEYHEACWYAAIQIWASIKRHKGEPNWRYVDGIYDNRDVQD